MSKDDSKNYVYRFSDEDFVIRENDQGKICSSKDYNFIFNKCSGDFARWGRTKEEDPQFSPVGPEILDLEISVNGCSMGCNFCLPKGALVNVPGGTIEIQEIKKGDKVLGFDFEKGEVREEIVIETSSRQYKGKLVIIELEDGRIIELTEDHKVMTRDGREIRAGDLSADDDVVIL